MEIDYRRIVHLATAVRAGSLTAAAALLGISQPALSKSIATLEASLGVRLLERGRFGVRATRFGEVIVDRGNVVEAEIRGITQDIRLMKRAASVRLVIGCGPSEATRLLPQTLIAFGREHPEVRVTVLYGLNETLMPMVKRGDIEFALSSVPRTASDPDLNHESLLSESAAVIARPDHPLARRRGIAIDALVGQRWVLARRRELERKALDDLFLEAGLRPPDPETETTSAILLKAMVLQGEVLSFLPRELIHWEARAGQLVCLDIIAPAWQRIVGITSRRRGRMGTPARALAAALRVQASLPNPPETWPADR